MAEEIVVSPTALANGENESNDKEFPDAVGENESNDKEFPVAVAVEEENTSDKDAAAADRGAAVELFIKKIQDLEKASLLDLQHDRIELSDFRAKLANFNFELSDLIAKLASIDSEISRSNEELHLVQISRLEGKLRILEDVIKDLEAKLKIKTNEQEKKSLQDRDMQHLVQISYLEGKLRILEDVIKDLEAKLKIKTNEQEKKPLQNRDMQPLQNRDMQGGVSTSLMQLRALGVGVAVGALGTLCLIKRK